MRTTEGPKRVDVIYRRVDDDFSIHSAFRPDSALGVPALMTRIAPATSRSPTRSAPGSPTTKRSTATCRKSSGLFGRGGRSCNNVPTWRCRKPEASRLHVLRQSGRSWWSRKCTGSGGYGMLVGPAPTGRHRGVSRQAQISPRAVHRPADARAVHLSDLRRGQASRRSHVDLRPFVLTGADRVRIVPGGLTRVALKAGSLVVNSSQGGGTKDTWVLDVSNAYAVADRRQPVLARALYRAGGLSVRAFSKRRSGWPPASAMAERSTNGQTALSTAAAQRAFVQVRDAERRERHRHSWPLLAPKTPSSIRALFDRRPRQCRCGTHRTDQRRCGTRSIGACARAANDPATARAARKWTAFAFPHWCAGRVPFLLRRLGLSDHAAR